MYVHLRFTPEEAAELEKAARDAGFPCKGDVGDAIANFCRDCVAEILMHWHASAGRRAAEAAERKAE
jgi:hypothetical protein